MLRTRVAGLLLIVLSACKSEQAAPEAQNQAASTTPAPSDAKATEPAAEPDAGKASGDPSKPDQAKPPEPTPTPTIDSPPTGAPMALRFWVAHEGMHAYDLDGNKLSSMNIAGSEIRRLADGRLIAFEPQPKSSRLLMFDASGKQLRAVELPGDFDDSTCAPIFPTARPAAPPEPPTGASETGDDDADDDWSDPLGPQESSAVAFDKLGKHACLRLQDRNDNMADKGMLIAVELSSGALRQRVTMDVNDACSDKGDLAPPLCEDIDAGTPWIEGDLAPPPASKWTYAYDEAGHTLSKVGGKPVSLCVEGADPADSWGQCTEHESTSPSGRWVLLTGSISEGDYIHRELLLLDLDEGKLWRVHEYDDGPRFVAIAPGQIFSEADVAVMSAVGESDIGWLPNDRLWIDGRLLIPESKSIVRIGGTRVRTL